MIFRERVQSEVNSHNVGRDHQTQEHRGITQGNYFIFSILWRRKNHEYRKWDLFFLFSPHGTRLTEAARLSSKRNSNDPEYTIAKSSRIRSASKAAEHQPPRRPARHPPFRSGGGSGAYRTERYKCPRSFLINDVGHGNRDKLTLLAAVHVHVKVHVHVQRSGRRQRRKVSATGSS